jgi:hypothetical protein
MSEPAVAFPSYIADALATFPLLPPQSVVGRLALVDQVAEIKLRRHDGPGRDSR